MSGVFPNMAGATSNQAAFAKTPIMKSRHCASIPRTVALRFVFVSSLIVAAAVCAIVTFRLISSLEQQVGEQTFESIANSALLGAQAITNRKVQGSEVMATFLSFTLPNAEQWPMIKVNGYMDIAEKVATLSASSSQALIVRVDPLEAEQFENHTANIYIEEGRPDGAGASDFGFGIWTNYMVNASLHPEDGRARDTSGETVWGGERRMLAPIMLHNVPNPKSLMYNTYSDPDRGIPIDSMISCAEAHADAGSPKCAVVTDMLELVVRPGPAALLFQPVYPANDPTTLVAFTGTSMHWDEVLTATVPSYVSGLTCVISTGTESFTYEIRQGGPELVGPGDLHDRAYSRLGRSVILNDIETNATASSTYTLTVYPTKEMLSTFETTSPLAVALGFFGSISLCAVLFFLYDFLMRHEAKQRKLVLEMKRRFVRFISHEIRTPLNTVCMGLELLESELEDATNQTREVAEQDKKVTEEDLTFWQSVTNDIKENSHVAVTVLNDLLNYDKIETGTLKLELDKVHIWEFVATSVSQFQIQAVKKKVELKMIIEKPQFASEPDMESGEQNYSSRFSVLGDDVRLGQVVRNVISNALKFTPPEGVIEVKTLHIKNGLPNAATPKCENGDPICPYPRAGSIQIRVKDEGVGLEPEQLQTLFNEGVQFNANKLQHGGGSGLGLAIAKGVVEQHGGTISAESAGHGTGSTFIVELPLFEYPPEKTKQQTDDKESTAPTVALTSSSCQGAPEFKNRRILVVEDSESSRKMLVRLLERSGHACAVAVNGEDAVTAMRNDLAITKENPDHIPFDTILMDFEMPLLNGPEATKRIREMGSKTTILGVTGNVLSEDVEYFMVHGADEVLPKPISMKLLKAYWERAPGMGKSSLSQHSGVSHK